MILNNLTLYATGQPARQGPAFNTRRALATKQGQVLQGWGDAKDASGASILLTELGTEADFDPNRPKFRSCWLRFDRWEVSETFLKPLAFETYGNADGDGRGDWTCWGKVYRKLPVSCIESAEHVVRTHNRGWREWAKPEEGDGAERGADSSNPDDVLIKFASGKSIVSFNVTGEDIVEAAGRFGQKLSSPLRLVNKPHVGQGWAFVRRGYEGRADGEWTVHCIAIVGRHRDKEQVIIIERFANDEAMQVECDSDWSFKLFAGVKELHERYSRLFDPEKYVIGAIDINR